MFAHIKGMLFNTPLLTTQDRLSTVLEGLTPRLMEGIKAQHSGTTHVSKMQVEGDTVAVIPIHGTLINRGFEMNANSEPMMSYAAIGSMFQSAMADDSVGHIVLDMDSNGGQADGAFDLSDLIYNARGTKPITAIVDSLALSAGYLIASAADTIVLSRTSQAGSIGVVAAHLDRSKSDAEKGLNYTFIYAGDKKIDGNQHEPLSSSALSDIQSQVDNLYGLFVDTVARNRNLSAQQIRDTQAGVFIGKAAVVHGLADDVAAPRDYLTHLVTEVVMTNPTIVASGKTPDTGPKLDATPHPVNSISVENAQSIITACTKAGFPALAGQALAQNVTLENLESLFDQARAIKTACATALQSDKAESFIAEGKGLDAAKAALFDLITADGSDFRKSLDVTSKTTFLNTLADRDSNTSTSNTTMPATGQGGDGVSASQLWDSVIDDRKKAVAHH